MMANFPVDSRPIIPLGFNLVHIDYVGPMDRCHAYLGSSLESHNDNIAIASFTPKVAKEDYLSMAVELRRRLAIVCQTDNIEV